MSATTKPTFLTKDQILNAKDLTLTEVPVPEWGGSVHLRILSAADRDAIQGEVLDDKGEVKKDALRIVQMGALALALCDGDGQPMFTLEDLNALGKKSALVLERLFKMVEKQNAVTPETGKNIKKNS